jgi:PAS domain-containing protein
VFENRVVKRIFGLKRDEVTGDRRKLHNEELHNLYSSPNIYRVIKSRRMRLARHVARMGRRGMHIGRARRKRPLGRPRRRWMDNIKMDLRGIEWDDVDWIDMAQDRDQWRALVNTVSIFPVP